MNTGNLVSTILCVILAVGCVATSPNDGAPNGAGAASPGVATPDDASGGALRLDQISVTLQLGAVEVRVTPLHERVIGLAAPDLRPRLRRLLAASSGDVEPVEESRFLVTFTSRTPDQVFFPADLRFEFGGVRVESPSIVPVTSAWGSQRLRVREPESAVYVVRGRFDPYSSLRVLYGSAASDGWREVIPVLRAEERRADRSAS